MTLFLNVHLSEGIKFHARSVDIVLINFVGKNKESPLIGEFENLSDIFIRLDLTGWVSRVDNTDSLRFNFSSGIRS